MFSNGSAYRCFCTEKRLDLLRKAALKLGEVPKYDNKCRHLSSTEVEEKISRNTPHVVRLKVDSEEEHWKDLVFGDCSINVLREGDPVLLKSDQFPTYHLANIVDDHHMGITHVLRGSEWQISTGKHLSLYRAFGWSPPQYAHLPLLVNSDGSKLSKRQDALHVEHYKTGGYLPESVINLVLSVGGGLTEQVTSPLTLSQYIPLFSLDRISTHNCQLDIDKISDYNQAHISRRLQDANLRGEMVTQLQQMVHDTYSDREHTAACDEVYVSSVLDWAQTRIHRLSDLVADEFHFLWSIPSSRSCSHLTHLHPDPAFVLQTTLTSLDSLTFADMSEVKDNLKVTSAAVDMRFGAYMQLMRLAISGLKVGPPVAEMMSILGKETTISRLEQTRRLLDT